MTTALAVATESITSRREPSLKLWAICVSTHPSSFREEKSSSVKYDRNEKLLVNSPRVRKLLSSEATVPPDRQEMAAHWGPRWLEVKWSTNHKSRFTMLCVWGGLMWTAFFSPQKTHFQEDILECHRGKSLRDRSVSVDKSLCYVSD